jgi:cysteine desulfurase/selenocysteine lyase
MAPNTLLEKDYRADFTEFGDVTYLEAAGEAPLPLDSVRAAKAALEWKESPHTLPASEYFDLPDRVRSGIARLIGGKPEEVAIAAGASNGFAAVAHGLDWKPGDEVLVARGEFPAQFATWLPLEQRCGICVKTVAPRDRFVTAEDFLAPLGPKTKLVSASLVRFDDASRLDAQRVAAACHAAGAYLLLDVSQCAGAMPMDIRALGADFAVCAGYKWLLSPYGTGFFWIRSELIEQMLPSPVYWAALEGARDFNSLSFDRLRITPGASRWDSPETANFTNLAAMDASLQYLLRVGVETIWQHITRLTSQLVERLPRDRCVLASPAEVERRGPFVCISARRAERTPELHKRLREGKIFVSLREGSLRVAPHLYNTERDITRLIAALSV